jgi:hypothetical protein
VQSPLQQSAADEHVDPFDAQVAPWHVPPLQLWLQHALLAVHVAPSAVQLGCAQRLFVQVPLQQSLPCSQTLPEGSQVGAAHFPCVQALEQQSLGPLHASPTVPHAAFAHLPFVHDSLQHWLYVVQAAPTAPQAPAGVGVLEGVEVEASCSAGGVYPGRSPVDASGEAAQAATSATTAPARAIPTEVRAMMARLAIGVPRCGTWCEPAIPISGAGSLGSPWIPGGSRCCELPVRIDRPRPRA